MVLLTSIIELFPTDEELMVQINEEFDETTDITPAMIEAIKAETLLLFEQTFDVFSETPIFVRGTLERDSSLKLNYPVETISSLKINNVDFVYKDFPFKNSTKIFFNTMYVGGTVEITYLPYFEETIFPFIKQYFLYLFHKAFMNYLAISPAKTYEIIKLSGLALTPDSLYYLNFIITINKKLEQLKKTIDTKVLTQW
jgi:hypothetical protein